MAPSSVERSFSMTDVDRLTKHCLNLATISISHGRNLATPYDFSAAVGYGDKKDIFKIIRPSRKFPGNEMVGLLGGKSLTTKNREKLSPSIEANSVPVDKAFHIHTRAGQLTGYQIVEHARWSTRFRSEEHSRPQSSTFSIAPTADKTKRRGLRTRMSEESSNNKAATSGPKDVTPSRTRPRSKSEDYPRQSISEGTCSYLREVKSLMLFPHLKTDLWSKNTKAKHKESELVFKFPEKSVLLLAQDEDDQVQIQLSTSSVVSRNSQQSMRRRKADSGVQISDNAVMSWSREEQSKSETTIPSTSGLIGSQTHLRRVATKSSLQSNYIPSLQKLIEEPVLPHKFCKQQATSSAVLVPGSVSSEPNERKDLSEVVVSHWERAEQQQYTQQQPASSCSPKSSLSLVNEVTEEVLFKRSSTNINESKFEEKAKDKTRPQQRRITIASESPGKELSPSYATKLEKQAFKKIKEWKEAFAIKLDQVLQQRQPPTQCRDKKAEVKEDSCSTDSPSSTPPSKDDSHHTFPSSSDTEKPKPVQDTRDHYNRKLVTELKKVSKMSIRNMRDGCDTGTIILKQIKKQRKYSEGLDENKKLMEDLSFWHKQETGRIASDLSTCTSDAQSVKQLLASLKETIDDIFVTTIQRVSDGVMSSTSRKNSGDPEQTSDTLQQELLLRWQIKNTQEERDRLFLENISLRKEIADLQNRLAEASKGMAELTSLKQDAAEVCSPNKQTNIVSFVGIEEVQKATGSLEKYAGYDFDLEDMTEITSLNNAENENSKALRIRQIMAETGIVYRNKLEPFAECDFDCLELFSRKCRVK